MNNYRSRIYEKYVSKFKDGSTIFNEKDSLLWRKGYKWWFRHWQPTNKDAKILDVACGGGDAPPLFQGSWLYKYLRC